MGGGQHSDVKLDRVAAGEFTAHPFSHRCPPRGGCSGWHVANLAKVLPSVCFSVCAAACACSFFRVFSFELSPDQCTLCNNQSSIKFEKGVVES